MELNFIKFFFKSWNRGPKLAEKLIPYTDNYYTQYLLHALKPLFLNQISYPLNLFTSD
jgi:hypothetical protein